MIWTRLWAQDVAPWKSLLSVRYQFLSELPSAIASPIRRLDSAPPDVGEDDDESLLLDFIDDQSANCFFNLSWRHSLEEIVFPLVIVDQLWLLLLFATLTLCANQMESRLGQWWRWRWRYTSRLWWNFFEHCHLDICDRSCFCLLNIDINIYRLGDPLLASFGGDDTTTTTTTITRKRLEKTTTCKRFVGTFCLSAARSTNSPTIATRIQLRSWLVVVVSRFKR